MQTLTRRLLLAAAIGFPGAALVGCSRSITSDAGLTAEQRTAQLIERSNGGPALASKPVIHADLAVDFGGNRIVEGKIAFTNSGSHVRIDRADGSTLVFDGLKAWVSPVTAKAQRARFHLLTWPYFALAAFKLDDGGTKLVDAGMLPLDDGKRYPTMKLTFSPGTGDAPDDWYLVYRDAANNRVAGLAYIVSYGTAPAEAEKDPHAVVYSDFRTIDGVTFPQTWTFYNWSLDSGVTGEPIGRASFTNVSFGAFDPSWFAKPVNAREDELPTN